MITRRFLAFSTTLLLLVGSMSARTWTDVDGRTMKGELLSHDGKVAVFRLDSGKETKVPLSRLSETDQRIVTRTPPGGPQPKLNWNERWPDHLVYRHYSEVESVEENPEKSRWIYESENYRFTCDVRLTIAVVRNFAEMFESTLYYTSKLPLAMTGGLRKNGKYDIFLYEEFSNYVKSGGPPKSAGVFISGPDKSVILVPLRSLGVRKVGDSYVRDSSKSNRTLVHEITHQLTPGHYFKPGARGWFSEGVAEYCALTPYQNGRFGVRKADDTIKQYVTNFDRRTNRGRNIGTNISVPDLKSFMMMPYSQFAGSNANFNYGVGALLTLYFFHYDGEGDAARIKELLKVLRIGARPEAALEKLLDGRSWDELEAEITVAFNKERIKITFR